MKAIVYRRYGSPEALHCEDIEEPAVGDDHVRIKVRTASINPLDWHQMRGTPYIMRVSSGPRRPTFTRLGIDVAGHVDAVGKNVTRFKPGDEVFGAHLRAGALAEYACAPESALAIKPANVTFEQAAAVPVAGFTALLGLRDKGRVQPGQRVLINGAAGGVGTFAVQIARWLGADVTGVCSQGNLEMVRSIGDQVIDYTQQDFIKSGQRYDVLLDAVGNHSLHDCLRVLNPSGVAILVTGPNGRLLGPLGRFMRAWALSPFVSQKLVPSIARPKKEDLPLLQELMRTGKVIPVIDRCYRLSEASEAIRYLEAGHARGKVIITVGTTAAERTIGAGGVGRR